MGPLLLGLAALVLVLALLGAFTGADTGRLVKLLRYLGVAFLVALAIFLVVVDRWPAAVFVGGLAWSLFTRGHIWPGGWPYYEIPGGDGAHREQNAPRETSMSRKEALKVLGLEEGARDEDIRAAHRRLILQNHPDKGGSDYLASKINEAKDVLLDS